MKKILFYLFIISFIFTLFLGVLNYVSFDRSFYLDSFEKYNVYLFNDKELINNEFNNIISYVKGDSEELISQELSENEKLHLRDVRNLFKISFFLFNLCLGILLLILFYSLYNKKYKIISKGLKKGSLILISFIFILSLLSFFMFSKFWDFFHEIFFKDNYAFYSTDFLKILFPDTLFFGLVFRLFFIIFLVSLLILAGCYIFNKKIKKS